MRKSSLVACACGVVAIAIPAFAAPPPVRQHILLDSDWRFYRGEVPGTDLTPHGVPVTTWRWSPIDDAAFAAPGISEAGPIWREAAIGEDVFRGKVGFGWFRATLPAAPGPNPILHFESVDDNAAVYLNGVKIASHSGWNDPFDVDLSSAWKPNAINVIALRVENTDGPGGIAKPVLLEAGDVHPAVGPALFTFDDSSWQTVHLPHDYVVDGKFTETADRGHGYLPTPTGWYRKSFVLPRSDSGKSIWIDFDGVYRDSLVWVNGHYLGRHTSGYTPFRYDIGSIANYGGKNEIAVHVDPSKFEGWWYEGGGIYRHVWLNIANRVHVAPHGTIVTTSIPEPKPNQPLAPAEITINTLLQNDTSTELEVTVDSVITDDLGKMAGVEITRARIMPGHTAVETHHVTIDDPRLWSLEAPHLYHLATTLHRDGVVVDRTTTDFGIRTVRFDPNTGLYLNGKPVKIRGVCNHQDFAGLGIAVPDSLEYWRVKQLQEMGANGWRMSHNPPTESVLDACDRLGMLVMDETRRFQDSDEAMDEVEDMVSRDRNHPSIIMWSMANEEGLEGTDEGGKIFAKMRDLVHRLDPTRPVTSAMNNPGTWGHGFSLVEDLQGCNYGSGADYDRFHAAFPNQPMFGSETASTTTTRGSYSFDRAAGHDTSYNMTDWSWSQVAERPFMAGSFVWTGFDYKGEPTPFSWPDINSNFGIMDMCGFPKDNYYYYQSWWKQTPIVHIMPHWNWPDKLGKPIRVIVFSNAPQVDLLLNGQSLGTKSMPRYGHVEWDVTYAPGTLMANGYDESGYRVASDTVETTGAPVAVRVRTDRTTLTADAEDLTPVEVDLVDAKGRIVPTANALVTFKVTGPGHISGVGNGDPSDHDPDHASYRHAFNGKCMVIVGADDRAGGIHLSATSPGLEPAELELESSIPKHR